MTYKMMIALAAFYAVLDLAALVCLFMIAVSAMRNVKSSWTLSISGVVLVAFGGVSGNVLGFLSAFPFAINMPDPLQFVNHVALAVGFASAVVASIPVLYRAYTGVSILRRWEPAELGGGGLPKNPLLAGVLGVLLRR